MKTPKNNSHPEKETVFSAGHGNEDQLSFFGKILGGGKRAAQRGFTFIEIAFVITAFLVLSAIIYTTVGGSGQLDPLKAKSLLQNTKTVAAAVRRASKYLESTPLNLKALVDKNTFLNEANNSRGISDLNGTAIGAWSGPYVEGIVFQATVNSTIIAEATSATSSLLVADSTVHYQNLKDITSSEHKGYLYVGSAAAYFFIGDFGLDDPLLINYYNLCNDSNLEDAAAIKGELFESADKPDKNCIIVKNGATNPFANTSSSKGDLRPFGTNRNRVNSAYISRGKDGASTSSQYMIGYRIVDTL